jgi:hypothetical protein
VLPAKLDAHRVDRMVLDGFTKATPPYYVIDGIEKVEVRWVYLLARKRLIGIFQMAVP